MIREEALKLLKAKGAKPGETVEFSFFLFQLVETDGELDLETLDFQEIASYTKDFEIVDRIHVAQVQVLQEQGAEPAFCNLRQCAVCSKSYAGGSPQAFMSRIAPAHENEAGWFIGVSEEHLDLDDPNNLTIKSLYELSLRDRRLLPYWLLPPGFGVLFGGEATQVVREGVP